MSHIYIRVFSAVFFTIAALALPACGQSGRLVAPPGVQEEGGVDDAAQPASADDMLTDEFDE